MRGYLLCGRSQSGSDIWGPNILPVPMGAVLQLILANKRDKHAVQSRRDAWSGLANCLAGISLAFISPGAAYNSFAFLLQQGHLVLVWVEWRVKL